MTKDSAKKLVSEGCLERIVEFRHWMHQNAEGQLGEWETQKGIKRMLMEVAGIPESKIIPCAGTGLIVTIKGENDSVTRSKPLCMALRADIDGLLMQESNADLPYRSRTPYAHMCGHDGHTAILILAACLLW